MAQETTALTTQVNKPKRTFSFSLILSLILGLLALGLSTYNFFLQKQEQRDQAAAFETRLAQLTGSLDQVEAVLGQKQGELLQIEQRLDLLKENKAPNWQLQEIAYAIRLADLNLKYALDPSSASVLLTSVAEQLAKTSEPKFDELRKLLAKDIATIQALKSQDPAAIVIKLQALSEQALNLPSNIQAAAARPAEQPLRNTELSPWWQKGWQQTYSVIKQLVVIRHYDKANQAFIPRDQQQLLVRLIQIHLTQAQWAVLHGDQALYQYSLQQSTELAHLIYGTGPQKTAFVSNLQELQALKINLPRPELANTLAAIPVPEKSLPADKQEKAQPRPKTQNKQEAALV